MGEPLPSKSDQTDTTSQNTPLRVTRSSSKSSATSSPAKKIGSTKGTRLKSNKPPLKLLKDPFSPQITEEQKEELNKRKEAKNGATKEIFCGSENKIQTNIVSVGIL